MKIELYNDGTMKVIDGIRETTHTYTLNQGYDRTLYTIYVGDVVSEADVEPEPEPEPANEPDPMTTGNVVV
jgi:hypothetical protein